MVNGKNREKKAEFISETKILGLSLKLFNTYFWMSSSKASHRHLIIWYHQNFLSALSISSFFFSHLWRFFTSSSWYWQSIRNTKVPSHMKPVSNKSTELSIGLITRLCSHRKGITTYMKVLLKLYPNTRYGYFHFPTLHYYDDLQCS